MSANICMGCMSDRGGSPVCVSCRFVEGTGPENVHQLPPRTLIARRYVLGRVVGQGGFGITYIAWDQADRRKVAVKEFFPQSIATRLQGSSTVAPQSSQMRSDFEHCQRSFADEARVLMLFRDNPCIVSFLDFVTDNGTGYLVMEYLDGMTLKDYLRINNDRMPSEAAVGVIMMVLDGLKEVHSRRGADRSVLLHRDISPDNIFLTQSRQVKILDFGASRFAIGERSQSLSIILKPGFAPPEQYQQRARQGPGTDLYAVGATLYKAVTGKTPPQSLERRDGATMPMPSKLGINVPRNVEAAIQKALMLQLEDRFSSADRFQQALKDPKPVMVTSHRISPNTMIKPAPSPLLAYFVGIISCFGLLFGFLAVFGFLGIALKKVEDIQKQALSQGSPKVSDVRYEIAVQEQQLQAKLSFQIRPFHGRTGCAAVFFQDGSGKPIKDAAGETLGMQSDFTPADEDAPWTTTLTRDLKGSGLSSGPQQMAAVIQFYANACRVQNDPVIFRTEQDVTLNVPAPQTPPTVSEVKYGASIDDGNLVFELGFQINPFQGRTGCALVSVLKDGSAVKMADGSPLLLFNDFTVSNDTSRNSLKVNRSLRGSGLASGTQDLQAVFTFYANPCAVPNDTPVWKSDPTAIQLTVPDYQ